MLYRDGLHDDTEAIQAKLDECGCVTIEGGIYLISKPLIVHSNTALSLAPDAVMMLADGANCAIIENDALEFKGTRRNSNISIRGGIWNGNNPNQQRRSRDQGSALPNMRRITITEFLCALSVLIIFIFHR